MERCLQYVRLLLGTESKFDRLHADIPPEVGRALTKSGLSDVTGFRRGTDFWRYMVAEPDGQSALERYAETRASKARMDAFVDIVAEATAPEGGPIWYDEIFQTDAPAPEGPWERARFSLVIDPRRADLYDELHAEPWPEMLEAIAEAGYRDYSGFRRGAHVVYVGRYYQDFETVIAKINATDVAARWGKALEGVITTFTDDRGRNFTAQEVYHLY